ncbi:hypothetical protein [Streptomyces sp. NBC_00847]|uniref:hypothetical protein n=1 Tax=Streptomyces sp. NBC_00847 TaxID=2975850 RepID=UPI00225AFCFC|nr:hypothetical protein [Streptomyces sp. NBC_00847]MCX4884692.1 hypothetical protein [Streptomyces sp. NBC_00847]
MAGYLVNITNAVWDAAAYQEAAEALRHQPGAAAAPHTATTSVIQAHGSPSTPRRR